MIRKSTLILLGAAAGAVMTLLATQPGMISVRSTAKAAADDTYRQLNLFGEVFERVRADAQREQQIEPRALNARPP